MDFIGAADEIDQSSAVGENTIVSSSAYLIDTLILNSSDIIGNDSKHHPKKQQPKEKLGRKRPAGDSYTAVAKDCAGLVADEDMVLECMAGGNFNTFGEHTPN